jgi:DNA-binding transcriptional MerR regulator
MITAEIGPLTVREVARHLGVHPNTVKRISPSDLPYMRVTSRGDRRYHPDDVQAYIDRRTVK